MHVPRAGLLLDVEQLLPERDVVEVQARGSGGVVHVVGGEALVPREGRPLLLGKGHAGGAADAGCPSDGAPALLRRPPLPLGVPLVSST